MNTDLTMKKNFNIQGKSKKKKKKKGGGNSNNEGAIL